MYPQDKYVLLRSGTDRYRIINDDANSFVGGGKLLRDGRLAVTNEDCEQVDIVNSLDEIIPAIRAYYGANPPQWAREPQPDLWHTDIKAHGPRYMKQSPFGPFIVFQIASGQWVAFRNQCELLFDGKMATFASREEAQRKADAHERDGYPNSEMLNDGYSWNFSEHADWRQNADIVANRAAWLVPTNTR
jgi:hypothetical protein